MGIWVQRVPVGLGWVSGQEEWEWGRAGEDLSTCCRVRGRVLCLHVGLGARGYGGGVRRVLAAS